MKSKTTKTIISLAACHFLADCYGGVWPIFKYMAGLDLEKAGLIATLSVFIGSSLQPFFGVLADRGRQRLLILLGATLCTASMLLGPISHLADQLDERTYYLILLSVMLLVLIGAGMFHPAGTSLAGNISQSRRTTMISIFIAAGLSGFSISQGLFSWVYRQFDGHTEVMYIPAACIICAGLIWCRPPPVEFSKFASPFEHLRSLFPVRVELFQLYIYEALMFGVGHAFIFLMPEFIESFCTLSLIDS